MDTILSVDLDVMMSPYCGIYNDMVMPTNDRDFNWKVINERYSVRDFSVDKELKQKLKEIITKYASNLDRVYIAYDHSAILNAIQAEMSNLNKDYKFDVYNIDYHHDIFYGEFGQQKLIDQYVPNCGSWVGFLKLVDCLNSYTWYAGEGSSYDKKLLQGKCVPVTTFKKFRTDELPQLKDVKVMFIALSLPWIPPHLTDELFEVVNDIDQDKLVYLEGPYSVNMDKKHFLDRI